MTKIIFLILFIFIFPFYFFGQNDVKNAKTIIGFVFAEADHYESLPFAEIENKRTGKTTTTNDDGQFSIEVIEGDVLYVNDLGMTTRNFTVTKDNCYKIYLNEEFYGMQIWTKKLNRSERQRKRINERKYKRKAKKGIYDCFNPS